METIKVNATIELLGGSKVQVNITHDGALRDLPGQLAERVRAEATKLLAPKVEAQQPVERSGSEDVTLESNPVASQQAAPAVIDFSKDRFGDIVRGFDPEYKIGFVQGSPVLMDEANNKQTWLSKVQVDGQPVTEQLLEKIGMDIIMKGADKAIDEVNAEAEAKKRTSRKRKPTAKKRGK